MNAVRDRPAAESAPGNLRGWRRPTLVGLTGAVAVALGVGWPGRSADPAAWEIALIVGALAATGMWIRSSRRSDHVEQLGPWLVLALAVATVQVTGGSPSPYRSLYLLPVLYAATFYPTARFLLLGLVAAVATVAPAVVWSQQGGWFDAAVSVVAWGTASAFLHGLVRRLNNAAQTDGLTSLWNHAAFWRRLHAEDARSQRTGTPYSVLMIDVDHFKKLNDKHGHQAGDAVLRRLSAILANRIRGSDVLARYGGEEFAVLLPETEQGRAAEVAEKLRRLLAVANISVSIGVADNAGARATPDEVVGAADAALYRAKLAGRAQVRSAAAVGPGTAETPRVRRAPTDRRRTRASG